MKSSLLILIVIYFLSESSITCSPLNKINSQNEYRNDENLDVRDSQLKGTLEDNEIQIRNLDNNDENADEPDIMSFDYVDNEEEEEEEEEKEETNHKNLQDVPTNQKNPNTPEIQLKQEPEKYVKPKESVKDTENNDEIKKKTEEGLIKSQQGITELTNAKSENIDENYKELEKLLKTIINNLKNYEKLRSQIEEPDVETTIEHEYFDYEDMTDISPQTDASKQTSSTAQTTNTINSTSANANQRNPEQNTNSKKNTEPIKNTAHKKNTPQAKITKSEKKVTDEKKADVQRLMPEEYSKLKNVMTKLSTNPESSKMAKTLIENMAKNNPTNKMINQFLLEPMNMLNNGKSSTTRNKSERIVSNVNEPNKETPKSTKYSSGSPQVNYNYNNPKREDKKQTQAQQNWNGQKMKSFTI